MSKIRLYALILKLSLTRSIGIMIILGISQQSLAQTYSLKINSVTFTLDDQSYSGYATSFTQPYKEVKKEWWRYVNTKTIIFNKKTHLVLTIPAKGRDSNAPLKFVSQLTEDKATKRSTLKMALVSTGVPDDQKTELKKQANHLLKDFKVTYFTRLVQEKIDQQELAGKKISLRMDRYLLQNSKLQLKLEKKPEQKNELAQKLKANTTEIEKLQVQLNNNQKRLNQFKKELTFIK